MDKALLAGLNKLRKAFGMTEIAENATSFDIDKDFIDKAQASIDNATTLQGKVEQLTTDLSTANTAKETAEGLLATEKTAHRATKDQLATAQENFKNEKAAHDKLKEEAAGSTTTTQETEDGNTNADRQAKINRFDSQSTRRK